MSFQVGDKLRSTDPRQDRVVRIIEVERGPTGGLRRLRVENVVTERRTFLSFPLRGRWARLGEDAP